MTFTSLVNARLCVHGELKDGNLVFSSDDGKILKSTGYIGGEIVDMEEKIIAPGYLELQTNGMLGFHFTSFDGDAVRYEQNLGKVSRYLITKGVTSFWATIPTVDKNSWKEILPHLKPRHFAGSAELLGAHAEGPYLHASKKGAHTDRFFVLPDEASAEGTYGEQNLRDIVKLVTLAPEHDGSEQLIRDLRQKYGIRVSIGHSSATFEQGIKAVEHGASALTHMFNAMNPVHHREPGLVGLLSQPNAPYYSLIGDGLHIHPSMLALAYRMNPARCILITDSIELLGMPDGVYPGNAQIAHQQEKIDGLVTFHGDPKKTMVGSCCDLETCVQTLLRSSNCSVAEAVQCVTENIANLMGLEDRGTLEEGRRADFLVLDDDARVLETWIAGVKVWDRQK